LGLLTNRVLSRRFVCHPCRNAGDRAVWLHDDHQLDAAVLELSPDQNGFAATRMKPIVDHRFGQMFVGSMSPF
jgi:hypothetical protein